LAPSRRLAASLKTRPLSPLIAGATVTVFALLFVAIGLSPVAGAAEFRASAQGGDNAATINILKPAGTVNGDVMLAAISFRGGTSVDITPPGGWATVGRTDHGTTLSQAVFSKVASGADPSSFTFTLSVPVKVAGGILSYRGVDPTSPIDQFLGQASVTASTSIVAPSVTPTLSNGILVGVFSTATRIAITSPASMATRVNDQFSTGTGGVSLEVADQALGAAAPTGTRTATAGATAFNIGQLIVLRPVSVKFDVASAVKSEADGTVNFGVSLSAATEDTVTVNYGITGGTAQGGGVDYTFTSGTLTFNPSETAKIVSLTIAEDFLSEDDEDVLITLSSPTGAIIGTIPTLTLTIQDNDPLPAVQFSASTSQASESVTSVQIPISLDAPAGRAVGVSFAATGGTASDGVDYMLTPAIVTFSAGQILQTVAFTVVNDGFIEGDETVIVELSSPNNAVLGATDAHTYTIQNDDSASIQVTETDGSTSVIETLGTDFLQVVLGARPTDPVVITVMGTDPTELTVSPLTLTFTTDNYNVMQIVTVSAVDDSIIDGNILSTVAFTVDAALSDDTFDAASIVSIPVITINDDFAGFTIVETSGTSVTELGSTDEFYVRLNAEPSTNVVLTVASADLGEVLVSVLTDTLTFTPSNWNVLQTVEVQGVNDDIDDGDQITLVSLSVDDASSDDDFDVVPDQTVSTTTVDDDTAGVNIAPLALTVYEGGATSEFGVVLNSEPTANVIVSLSIDAQLFVSPGQLTFTNVNWNSLQTVTVAAIDDSYADLSDLSTVVTTPLSADLVYASLDVADVTVTVVDDEVAKITVTPVSGHTTTEAGGTATFLIFLESLPTADVVIELETSDPSEGSVSPTLLTFTPLNADIPQLVTITGQDDLLVDGNIGYSINVLPAMSADPVYDGMDPDDVSVTNTDNDVPGFSVSETGGLTQVSESGTTDHLEIALTVQPNSNVVLSISSNDLGEATVAPAALTFTPSNWNIIQTVTVTGVDDLLVDGDVVSTLTISVFDDQSDDNFDPLGDETVSALTLDNDPVGIALSVSGGTTEVSEDAVFPTSDDFGIVLTGRPGTDVVLLVSSADITEAVVSLTTVTFTPLNYNIIQTVTVTAVDDLIADGTKETTISVEVDVGSSDVAYAGVPPATLSAFTHDDDGAGFTVIESGGLTTIGEDGTSDEFGVVLDVAPETNVVITVAVDDPSEVTVSTFTLTFTPDNWNVIQTVQVIPLDDGLVDGNQVTTVWVAVDPAESNDNFDALPPYAVSVTNVDDDSATLSFTHVGGSTISGEGGASDEILVRLNAIPLSNVVVTVASSDLTEITVWPMTLTFTPADWNIVQTVTVYGVNDDLVDGDQAVTLSAQVDDAQSSDEFDGQSATLPATNQDDDVADLVITTSGIGSITTEAGGIDEFYVRLSAEPLANVVISVVSLDLSEVDVSVATSSLVFTPLNWNAIQTVGIFGVNDDLVDGDQVIQVQLAVFAPDSSDEFDLVSRTTPVTNVDNDVAMFTLSEDGLGTSVAEHGASTDTIGVVLNAQPDTNVVLTVASGDVSEVLISINTMALTFTPANWNIIQSIEVIGVHDDYVDGSLLTLVSVSVDRLNSDDKWDDLAPQSVLVTSTDDDVAGVTLSESTGTSVTEAGSTDDVGVVLNARPVANVIVTIASMDLTEATVSPTQLIFTTDNWNVVQSVTVTGVNDDVDDGDVPVVIGFSIDEAASDAVFAGLGESTVVSTTVDDDTAGIAFTHTAGSTAVSEDGTTDTFDVRLTSEPTGTVVLNVESQDPMEVSASPTSLTFSPGNWNVPQTVTVTGVDDAVADGPKNVNVKLSADTVLTLDPVYDAVADVFVPVTNADNDVSSTTVAVAAPTAVAAEGTVALLTFVRVPVGGDLNAVNVAFDFGGSATFGADYTVSGATCGGGGLGCVVTIPANALVGTVTLTIAAGDGAEGIETVLASIVSGFGYSANPAASTATIRIVNVS
jgi:large repetitive protein